MTVFAQVSAACLVICTEITEPTEYYPIPSMHVREIPNTAIELVQASPSKPKDPFAVPYPSNKPSARIEGELNKGNPFDDSFVDERPNISTVGGCGPETSLGKAELRKPILANELCEGKFSKLDSEWLFILYYISGFNEFLEERGAFMDPTGACSRAVEPRHSLNLIYEVIDFVVSGGQGFKDDSRLERMLEPFMENKWRIPLVLIELNTWKREGRLDATSVASRGMCGDPKFKLFWGQAIEYAKRVPGTEQ